MKRRGLLLLILTLLNGCYEIAERRPLFFAGEKVTIASIFYQKCYFIIESYDSNPEYYTYTGILFCEKISSSQHTFSESYLKKIPGNGGI